MKGGYHTMMLKDQKTAIIEANRTASPNAAFGIYLTVFILYFLACWPISLLAGYLEKKWK